MSALIVVCGSVLHSSHLQTRSSRPPSCRASFQSATLICGVGPADRIGKSAVTCCPGGTRLPRFGCARVDLKPRDIGGSSMELVSPFVESGPAWDVTVACRPAL